MTPHESQPRPVTAAGALLLRYLGSDTVANAGARAYVERVLAADGSATGRRVDAAEKMLVGKLVGRPRATLPLREQDLVLVLAVDMARELVPDRLPELVRAAEDRLRWMLTHPGSQGLVRRLQFRRVRRELGAAAERAGPPLRTTAGEVLAALVRNDLEESQRLAGQAELAAAEPVVHAVFAAAVRYCLASVDDAAVLRKAAVPAARRCSSVLISAEEVERMLRHELDPSAPPPDLDRDLRVEAEMSTVMSLPNGSGCCRRRRTISSRRPNGERRADRRQRGRSGRRYRPDGTAGLSGR